MSIYSPSDSRTGLISIDGVDYCEVCNYFARLYLCTHRRCRAPCLVCKGECHHVTDLDLLTEHDDHVCACPSCERLERRVADGECKDGAHVFWCRELMTTRADRAIVDPERDAPAGRKGK